MNDSSGTLHVFIYMNKIIKYFNFKIKAKLLLLLLLMSVKPLNLINWDNFVTIYLEYQLLYKHF